MNTHTKGRIKMSKESELAAACQKPPEELTEDELWMVQLEMSGFIARAKGDQLTAEEERLLEDYDPRCGGECIPIRSLKLYWLRENYRRSVSLHNNCFFCNKAKEEVLKIYGSQELILRKTACLSCPGKKVDQAFQCQNSDYNYTYYPIKFFQKLLWLDYLRKREVDEKSKEVGLEVRYHCNYCDHYFSTLKPSGDRSQEVIYCPRCTVIVVGNKKYLPHLANRFVDMNRCPSIIEEIGWAKFEQLYPVLAKTHCDKLRPVRKTYLLGS
jgi:hypothetical protein